MTNRIKSLLERTFDKEQAKFRRDVDWKPLLEKFIAEGVDDETRARMGLEAMLAAEEPAFMEGETIHFLRTVRQIPDLHSEEEMEARRKAGTAFGEKGVVFNLTADLVRRSATDWINGSPRSRRRSRRRGTPNRSTSSATPRSA